MNTKGQVSIRIKRIIRAQAGALMKVIFQDEGWIQDDVGIWKRIGGVEPGDYVTYTGNIFKEPSTSSGGTFYKLEVLTKLGVVWINASAFQLSEDEDDEIFSRTNLRLQADSVVRT